MPPIIDDKWYASLFKNRSRWGMTSGNLTPVADSGSGGHSVFAYQFLESLKNNRKPYLTPREIYQDIGPIIRNNSDQMPITKPIRNTGDQGGEFVFVRMTALSTSPSSVSSFSPSLSSSLEAERKALAEEQRQYEEEERLITEREKLAEKRRKLEDLRARRKKEREKKKQQMASLRQKPLSLPPKIQKDKYLVKLLGHLRKEEYNLAWPIFDRLENLKKTYGVELSDAFTYFHGETAYYIGKSNVAVKILLRYLSSAGEKGRYYQKALELLNKAEK